ncbi:MAG: excinuclease ABC subunit UvrC [Anaerolineae bacterium]|nr:excinuclease ABC subunit UvrC [Anaerolineae bacterium]
MGRSQLKEQLSSIPAKPGVYLMKDEKGKVIYVGKAVNLRNRVRSYFHASADHSPKTHYLRQDLANLDFIVTASELEALILECNLIKKYQPRYNVRLKDDKRYPYIKITWQEPYPRIFTVRRMQNDGAKYYGPFTATWAVSQTLDLLRKIFPYLTCKREITGQDKRACLYYHIGRCPGPCIGAVSQEEYRALVSQICRFLEGKSEEIIDDLRSQMTAASQRLEFERAAALRDQIVALERVIERQRVVSSALADEDVIAFARQDGDACVQVFFIRRGKLIGREYFVLEGTADEDARQIMTSFVKQFYDKAAYVPSEILLQSDIDEAMIIQSWLRSKRGTKVTLKVPQRGQKKELVQMAAENAAETLAHLRAQWLLDEGKGVEALAELQEHLELAQPPSRIECYDISNIQGQAATGSMVVFVKGVPRKSDYRRFKIRTVEGADDYAMMQEVLRRRFRRAVPSTGLRTGGDTKEKGELVKDEAWTMLPDLVVVDGGKGQLNAALEVMDEYDLREAVPVVGLAKEREEIFVPDQPEPILLPRGSQGLFLIQRIRDEAHRFALQYHRRLREKKTLTSTLEEIPGIGPKRRQALLKHFGSLEGIRQASLEELAAVAGMSRAAAQQVKEFL